MKLTSVRGKKDTVIGIRIKQTEKDQLKLMADYEDMSLASFIRMLLNEALEDRE